MSDAPIIPSQNSLVGQLVEILPDKGKAWQGSLVGKRGVIVSSWVATYKTDTENTGRTRDMGVPRSSSTQYTSTTFVQVRYEDGDFSTPIYLSRVQAVTEPNPRNKSEKETA